MAPLASRVCRLVNTRCPVSAALRAVWAVSWLLEEWLGGRLPLQAAAVVILVVAGLIVFALLAIVTGAASAAEFRALLRGRRPAA